MPVYDKSGHKVDLRDASVVFPFKEYEALRYHFDTSHTGWGDFSSNNLFTMAHISDLHTDPTRYDRFLKFANENATKINICAVTGDLVDAPIVSQFQQMTAKETYSNLDILKCVGNHEKKFDQSSMTNAQIYSNWNQITNTGEVYYYKDYPTYGIRIIALNPYDTDANPDSNHYTQTQLNWFIDTLKSAKTNNLAVIILRHNFDGLKTASNAKGFYQRHYQWETVVFDSKCSGTPIEDIVHAFMTGGSLTQTYTYTDGVASVSVDTSFSGNGHFVAYVCGHYHADLTGFSPKYADQLYLNAPQGVLISTSRVGNWNEVSDLPRIEGTKTEDLFNLYAFDIENKIVKICRVGSDVNDLLEDRKTTWFSYNGEELA